MAQKKKAPAKKAAPAPAKKAAPAAKPAAKKAATPAQKAGPVSERFTKTQIVTELADSTQLSKKQVQSVLDGLSTLIERHIKKKACGQFVLPGLMKIQAVEKPAKKAREGINPFTGQKTMFKAKPASVAVKVRPLSKLKEIGRAHV